MYCAIVYLLILLSKFTNSMDSQETQQDDDDEELLQETQQDDEELVPFDHEFTVTVRHFLLNTIQDFHLNTETRMRIQMNANNPIKLYSWPYVNDKCIPVRTPTGRYGVTQASLIACEKWCMKANLQYAAFFTGCISQMKEKFINENASRCGVKLNAVNLNTGTCVPIGNNKFECQCKTNYQIMITRFLGNLLERTINTEIHDENFRRQRMFTAYIYLLKFYPYSAGLYFAYMFAKEGIMLERFTYEISYFEDQTPNTDTQPQHGQIINMGSIIEYDILLHRNLLKQITDNVIKLQRFGQVYFSEFNPVTVFLVLANLVNLLF